MTISTQPRPRASHRDVQISALVLCLTCPFMAEVLSSNVSPFVFFSMAWGLVVVYGFPILLIREWAVRRGVSLGGILLAGFGYGLFNEGLIAKTLFLNRKVPWNLFDGHIGLGGVNWGWLLVICAYHALFSILTPMLLIERLRPQTAGQTWLSKRSAPILMAAVAFVSLAYFGQKPATAPFGFWILWASIGACIGLASFWRGAWTTENMVKPRAAIWTGVALLPALLLCSGAFAHGLPFAGFTLAWALIVFLVGKSATRGGKNGALLLGLGAFAGMSAQNMVVGAPIVKAVGAVALVVIVAWLRTEGKRDPSD